MKEIHTRCVLISNGVIWLVLQGSCNFTQVHNMIQTRPLNAWLCQTNHNEEAHDKHIQHNVITVQYLLGASHSLSKPQRLDIVEYSQ